MIAAAVAQKQGRGLFLEAEGEKPVELSRVWGAVIWPGNHPSYALVAGQEKDGKRVHLLAELVERDWENLVRRMVELGRSMHVSRWLHEGGVMGENHRDGANRLCREEMLTRPTGWGGWETLSLINAPYRDDPRYGLGRATGMITGGRLSARPGFEVLEPQLREAAGRPYTEVLDEMPDNLFAFRALVFLLSAMDAWQIPQEHEEEGSLDRIRDKLTGV